MSQVVFFLFVQLFTLHWKYVPHLSVSLILFGPVAVSSHTLLQPRSSVFCVMVSLADSFIVFPAFCHGAADWLLSVRASGSLRLKSPQLGSEWIPDTPAHQEVKLVTK